VVETTNRPTRNEYVCLECMTYQSVGRNHQCGTREEHPFKDALLRLLKRR